MKKTSTVPTPQTVESNIDLQEQIRFRAYELYQQRRREDGRDLKDWLRAESEVTQKEAKAIAA